MAVGIREAGRQLGINQNTILAWARRFNWQIKRQSSTASSSGPKQSSINLQSKPAAALQSHLQALSSTTRIGLARASAKAATGLSKLQTKELIKLATARTAQAWAGTAGTVHDWSKESAGTGVLAPLTVYSHQTIIGLSTEDKSRVSQEPAIDLPNES